jgi:hypothetical protein
MKRHMPWIYILLTFVVLLMLNLYIMKDGFYNFGKDPFSEYILSLITIDPDDKGGHGHRDVSGCPVPPTPPRPTPPTPPPPPPPPPPPRPYDPQSNALNESTAVSLIGYLKADIDANIRNQKRCERNEQHEEHKEDSDSTPCTEQGRQSTNCQRMDNSQFDMSEYIRKDSIPCWGCSF